MELSCSVDEPLCSLDLGEIGVFTLEASRPIVLLHKSTGNTFNMHVFCWISTMIMLLVVPTANLSKGIKVHSTQSLIEMITRL